MIRRFILCIGFAAFTSGLAQANDCQSHYAGGQPPEITNPKMTSKTQALCYEAFAVMYSGVTRTPLWSAEHLERSNIESAQAMSRENSFHADPNLPVDSRAELRDYARSGFDRGHMSPNGDMPTRNAQYESFSLANMIPQNPNNNRYIWEGIEAAVRRLAKSEGDLYVISGPAFIGSDIQKIGNVLVPTYIFKVVYSPTHNQAGAYFLKNEATKEYSAISVAQLEKTVGISLLPGVSQSVKDKLMNLPAPTPHNESMGGGTSGKHSQEISRKTIEDNSYAQTTAVLDVVEKLLKFLKK